MQGILIDTHSTSSPQELNLILSKADGEWIEIQESYSETGSQSESRLNLHHLEVLFALFLFSFGIAVFLKNSASWKHLRDRFFSVSKYKKIPCVNCRFFCNNPYLRCALHPDKALTTKAVNCLDYTSSEETK